MDEVTESDVATNIVYRFLYSFGVPVISVSAGDIPRYDGKFLDWYRIYCIIDKNDGVAAADGIIKEIRKRSDKYRPIAFGFFGKTDIVENGNHYLVFQEIGFLDSKTSKPEFNMVFKYKEEPCTTKTSIGFFRNISSKARTLKERLGI